MQDLAFTVDIPDHLDNQNIMLQCCSKVVTWCHDNICAFKSTLSLWGMRLLSNNPAHFSCLRDLFNAGSAEEFGQYKENISSLLQQSEWHFHEFDKLEAEFKIICSPFSVTPSCVNLCTT